MATQLLEERRKSFVLAATSVPCLGGVPTINITRGCLHRCVYCYALAFRNVPAGGATYRYANLLEKLREELDAPRRSKPRPGWVQLSTATDLFQPHQQLQETAYRLLTLLLERGIGVSFLTKGYIGRRFFPLFAPHAELLRAQVGITSLDGHYRDLFEPQAALPKLRLVTIRRLHALGIPVMARVDPIIPGITDREEGWEALFAALRAVGVSRALVSFLMVRPGIRGLLWRGLPPPVARAVLAAYLGAAPQAVITSERTQLLPRPWRRSAFQRLRAIAAAYSVEARLCACKNPDLPEAMWCHEELTHPPTQPALVALSG